MPSRVKPRICGQRMSLPCRSGTTYLPTTSRPLALLYWLEETSPGMTTRTRLSFPVVNRAFASNLFGSVTSAIGRYFTLQDGTRVQIVGVAEDGKYLSITEDQQPAIFLPSVRSPLSQSCIVVRSPREPQQLAAAMRSKLRELEAGLPFDLRTWNNLLLGALFPSHVATVSLGVLGAMGAMLSITCIFGLPSP